MDIQTDHQSHNPSDNAESHLRPYLDERAGRIAAPSPDIDRVLARVASHRRRRHRALGAVMVVVLGAGTFTAVRAGQFEPVDQIASEPGTPGLSAPALQWTTVTPQSGLGSSRQTVNVGGATYSLSTAPGVPLDPDQGAAPQLYRSADGIEWSTVDLPFGVLASSLASSGTDVYAVGTAPAGGRTGAIQVLSGAGGADWTTTGLPLDVQAIEQSADVTLVLGSVDVAAGPQGVLVAVSLQAERDSLVDHLPDPVPAGGRFEVTETGVDVFAPSTVAPPATAPAPTVAPTVPPAPPGTDGGSDAGDPKAEAAARAGKPEPAPDVVTASYSWAQLGWSDELRSLARGETRVFLAAPGQPFVESPARPAARWGVQVLATADGFRLVSTTNDQTTTVERSADGRQWTADPAGALPGYLMTAGTIDGRAVLVTSGTGDSEPTIRVEQPGGGWSALPLANLVTAAGHGRPELWSEASIGPLGVTVIGSEVDDEGHTSSAVLVHSPDGRTASVVAVPAPAGPIGWSPVIGASTADAITVLLPGAPTADGTPGVMQLFVGTRPR